MGCVYVLCVYVIKTCGDCKNWGFGGGVHGKYDALVPWPMQSPSGKFVSNRTMTHMITTCPSEFVRKLHPRLGMNRFTASAGTGTASGGKRKQKRMRDRAIRKHSGCSRSHLGIECESTHSEDTRGAQGATLRALCTGLLLLAVLGASRSAVD